ncbi:MAG: hypothetical protein RLZZ597_3071, partial [Cyanobacteriota bacterium]
MGHSIVKHQPSPIPHRERWVELWVGLLGVWVGLLIGVLGATPAWAMAPSQQPA